MADEAAVTELVARQKADYMECAADPLEFAWRHIRIETLTGRVFRPKWWKCQEKVMRTIHDEHRVVVLKARRMGLSWLALIYALWVAIFQQGARILILCKNEDDATKLLDRIRRMYYRLQEDPATQHLLTGLKEQPGDRKPKDAVTTLEIGASEIRALPAKARSARLETAAVVILDEFAFAQESAEIWRAILPTTEAEDETDLDFVDDTEPVLAGDGRLIVVSTGNGETGPGEEFHSQWVRARAGLSDFAHVFLSWRDRPDRDEAWAESMRRKMGDDDRFKVEYPETPEEAFLAPDADLVYDGSHLSEAVRAGAEVDKLIAQGKLNPIGGKIPLGIDFGTHTHILIGWELEGGGMHVFAEVAYDGADVTQAVPDVVKAIKSTGYRASVMRFDAAAPGLAVLFKQALERELGYSIKHLKIPFNKYKRMTIQHTNWMLGRTYNKTLPRLTISPKCKRYIEQMRRLEWKDDEIDKIVKVDDHGPDAGVALLAPEANKRQNHIRETTASG